MRMMCASKRCTSSRVGSICKRPTPPRGVCANGNTPPPSCCSGITESLPQLLPRQAFSFSPATARMPEKEASAAKDITRWGRLICFSRGELSQRSFRPDQLLELSGASVSLLFCRITVAIRVEARNNVTKRYLHALPGRDMLERRMGAEWFVIGNDESKPFLVTRWHRAPACRVARHGRGRCSSPASRRRGCR